MKSLITLLVCFGALCSTGFSQGAGAYHVFPLVADGSFPDGTFYRSTLFAVNPNTAETTCTYRSYGISEDRLQSSKVFKLASNGGALRATTSGNSEFASGYATLSCDKSVESFMQYEYVSSSSEVLGIATVFSAPSTSSAEFIFPVAAGYRLGLALANDGDTAATFQIRVGAINNSELRAEVDIPPHSKISKFVDELLTIPAGYEPVAVLIESISTPINKLPGKFHATGLILWQTSFSTVPPVVFAN